jgi:hypothetical protein
VRAIEKLACILPAEKPIGLHVVVVPTRQVEHLGRALKPDDIRADIAEGRPLFSFGAPEVRFTRR